LDLGLRLRGGLTRLRAGRGGGQDGVVGVVDDGAEVGRVGRAPGRVAGRAGDDPDADLGELRGQDVLAVARAVHPGDHDAAGGRDLALAPGDVLADGPVAVRLDVAAGLEAVGERRAVRGDVGEEVLRDHARRVGGGGLGEALRHGQRVQTGGGALV